MQFVIKLRIFLLKQSIKSWNLELQKAGCAKHIVLMEQDRRRMKLAQLEHEYENHI